MFREIAQGMALTLRTMFKKPITVQWPEEQKPVTPRHRGRHILHRYDNGLEKCIGCELCAAACPVGCIYVGPAENPKDHPFSPGERYAERYEINLMRCIYCGYCAEACPTEAITLGPRYDLADYRREHTVVTKAELLEAWPHFEQARGPVAPRGAGSDQRGRELPDMGVEPRVAWEAAQSARGDITTLPGGHGIASRPPAIAGPARRGDSGAVGGSTPAAGLEVARGNPPAGGMPLAGGEADDAPATPDAAAPAGPEPSAPARPRRRPS
jgi:NADH-quinone oxidoreductase subunit I